MPSASELKKIITSTYEKKRSYYDKYTQKKSEAMTLVENYLQSFIDANKDLTEDAAFNISILMLDELIENQQSCLAKKTIGVSTQTIIYSLFSAHTIKDFHEMIIRHGLYELYVPLFLTYSYLFYYEYLNSKMPINLRDFSVFCAWEAMMEAFELVTPSIMHESELLIEKAKHSEHPVISSEVVEWLCQLKIYFNITPSEKSFKNSKILFAIKESTLQLMLTDPSTLTQENFTAIEENPTLITIDKAVRAVMVKNERNKAISFHPKTITPQELLQAAKTAYYKGLSYSETYLLKMPKAMLNIEEYLQSLINTHQSLPENAAFVLMHRIHQDLITCFLEHCTKKRERFPETLILGIIFFLYILYRTRPFFSTKSFEQQIGAYAYLVGFALLIGQFFYTFHLDRDKELTDFGLFRAWEVILQKLDLAFIKGLQSTTHTSLSLDALSDAILRNPFPNENITKYYVDTGKTNKSHANDITRWLAVLCVNYKLTPSEQSFRSGEQLSAVISASEQLFTIEGLRMSTNLSILEKHANIYSSLPLRFMRRTGVLNQASFEALFSSQQAVLMTESIEKHLWSKLPSHLEIPPVWNRILECCELDNPEQKLIEYAKKLLEGNPLDRARVIINGPQSTHAPSVHRTISRSALALWMRYSELLQKTDLPSDDFFSRMLQGNRVKPPRILEQIENWVQSFGTDDRSTYAKIGFAKLKTTDFFHRDPGSNLTTLDVLRLAWLAIHDGTKRTGTLEDAKKRIKTSFYEIEREYRLTADGQEKDSNKTLRSLETCVGGAFNKILEALWGTHPDVNLEVIVKAGATAKLLALVAQAALLELSPLYQPKNIEAFLIFSYFVMQIKNYGLEGIVEDAAHYFQDSHGHNIADRLFEEYKSLYEDNIEHPEFVALLEAGNSASVDIPHFRQCAQISEGYREYCSQLLSQSGWFSDKATTAQLENQHLAVQSENYQLVVWKRQ